MLLRDGSLAMKLRPSARICLTLLLAASLGCRAPAAAPAPAAPALPTSAAVGGTNIVAIAPPGQQCCPKQTLPEFLGLKGLFAGLHGICDSIRNRLGAIWPGLEAQPAILALTDPANLESPNPAVSAAASVKAEEDAAAQKAKAIAYLASVGCAGCYPGIEEALLAALDDCTELVRFETAKALRSTAAMPCKNCCKSACCGPKIREKLEKLAYDLDAQGCYVESSDRVRRMARLTLASCSCVPPKPGELPRLPTEGPGAEDQPAPAATASIVKQAEVNRLLAAAVGPVGSGVAQAATPSPAMRQAQSVSFEQALAAYGRPSQPAERPSEEIAWEIWTARPGAFASREEAAHAMTLARVQVLSSQPGQHLPPQLQRASHGWTDPARLASRTIARAVATTPIGGVSGVIEDSTGLHLVRVVARRPAPAPTPVQPATAHPAQPVAYQSPIAAPPAPVVHIGTMQLGTMQPTAPGVANWQAPNCNCR
jgi:hypothetical protein